MEKQYSIKCSDRKCNYFVDVPMTKAEAVKHTKKFPCTLCGKKTKVYKDRALSAVIGEHGDGKFFVVTERWVHDGTWYKVVWARKKSWIGKTDEAIINFRDKAVAESFAGKLNLMIDSFR